MIQLRKLFISTLIATAASVSCTNNNSVEITNNDGIIYELNTRQFSKEGNFNGVRAQLGRLDSLGVDVIWLMPIYPIGELERKGNLGSYYAIADYCKINPEFGQMEDFELFLEDAHKRGIKVILDWVANHTSPDAKWIKEGNMDWYELDSLGKPIAPYDWTDVAKLNYNNQEMRNEMINSMKFWILKGVDGFRCDVAGEVPTDFWEQATDTLRKYNNNLFMLAEGEKPELSNKAFDMQYGWEFHHIMNKIAKGEFTTDSIRTYMQRDTVRFPKRTIKMNFTSNHDENSWNGTEFERMHQAVKEFAVLSYIMPGMPLIYNGQESGFNRRLLFFDKDSIDWSNNQYTTLYKELNKLRKENCALRSGENGGKYIELDNTDKQNIFSIARVKDDNIVIALFNLSAQEQEFSYNINNMEGEYNQFESSEKIILSSENTINLPAWSYIVYYK